MLWLLPLLAVGVASQVASAVVYLLARHAGLTVDFQSQSILTILVFGVGVDYALLLISRYREELRRHADRHRAMAPRCAGPSRPSPPRPRRSASALLCLLAADLPATRGLGPVCAVGVVAAFAVMTTLLPALVVLFGRWVFWPFVPRVGPAARPAAQHRVWRRSRRAAVRPLAPAGLARHRGRPGRPDRRHRQPRPGPARRPVVHQGGRVGHRPAPDRGALRGRHGLPGRLIASAATADQVTAAARATAGVAEVLPAEPSADGRWVRVRAVLADPPESDAAMATVERLRAAVHAVPGADALVGGETAVILDTERTAGRDNRVVMPLILGVVLLVLVLLLRALVAPLVLLASVVLSYPAALGAAGLILSAIGYPDLWVAIPLQTFLFLVALGRRLHDLPDDPGPGGGGRALDTAPAS